MQVFIFGINQWPDFHSVWSPRFVQPSTCQQLTYCLVSVFILFKIKELKDVLQRHSDRRKLYKISCQIGQFLFGHLEKTSAIRIFFRHASYFLIANLAANYHRLSALCLSTYIHHFQFYQWIFLRVFVLMTWHSVFRCFYCRFDRIKITTFALKWSG